VWDRNKKAGRREARRRSSVSSEGGQAIKGEAVEVLRTERRRTER